MKRIILLTTGGTIAMRGTTPEEGAVPALGGGDFTAALPQGLAAIRAEEFTNLPSPHFTIEQVWELSRRVAALAADETVDGIVVTHGTDVLEESAYLCDLTIESNKPIVFTGAMRSASEMGYDGTANLAAAVKTAVSERANGLGTLVVLNDQIHAAGDVTKTHTGAVETFKSPELGPLGYVDYGGVVVARRPLQREHVPASRLEPNVHLLKLAVGMSEGLLEYLVETVGARGVVLEGMGAGHVPPWWLPTIERTTRQGVAIVITSRTGAGRTYDGKGYIGAHRDLVRLGCWFAHGLNGQKARIKLMAALGTGDAGRYFQ